MTLNDYFAELFEASAEIMLALRIKSVSKERPRSNRGGRMYTPAKTRQFEKKVKEMASTISTPPFTCPVEVTVSITEPIPKSYKGLKREAAELNLITPPRGDLDNKVKAVTDALNGVAYLDDVQISDTHSSKCYGEEHSLYVSVRRSGLSLQEIENYRTRHVGNLGRGFEVG